ncbi:MAG: hypothetical protein K8R53_10885, partial [Bacteroidales bacterium]|nr:hypothetical protein [Bacteroidales bacterium]
MLKINLKRKLFVSTIIVVCITFLASSAHAQSENENLAKQLSNPVANLISVPIQNNLDMGIGEYGGSRLITNVQPVIPFNLSEKWILITRTILPIVTQHSITAPNESQTGLGDAVISGFFSPTASKII